MAAEVESAGLNSSKIIGSIVASKRALRHIDLNLNFYNATAHLVLFDIFDDPTDLDDTRNRL